jgi:hypothetical protein
MLTALVLVCSITVTPNLRACDASNARIVMRMPEAYTSTATCAMQGQAYFAQTALGQALADTDRVKVVCVSTKEADDAMASRP